MDRRQFIVTSTILGVAVGAFGFNFLRSSNPPAREVPVLEQIVAQAARSSDISKDALRHALGLLQNPDYSAVAIDQRGNTSPMTQPYSEDYFRQSKNIVVCISDAAFLQSFYDQMHPAQAKSVNDSVRYVIFKGDLHRDLGFLKEKVAGVSLGNGAVMIDPESNAEMLPGNLRHEASHEKEKGRTTTLESEYNALEAQMSVLYHQRNSISGTSYEDWLKRDDFLGRINAIREIQNTASYLKSFGASFQDFYPTNVILSKDLLAAKIEAAYLKQIANSTAGSKGIEQEMHYAAQAAYTALALPKGQVIARFYSAMTDRNSADFEKINAIFALAYLAPNAMKIEDGSVHFEKGHARGLSVSIGGGYKELIPDPQYEKGWLDFSRREVEIEASYKRKGGKRSDFEHIGSVIFPSHNNRFLIHGSLPPIQAFLENRPYQ